MKKCILSLLLVMALTFGLSGTALAAERPAERDTVIRLTADGTVVLPQDTGNIGEFDDIIAVGDPQSITVHPTKDSKLWITVAVPSSRNGVYPVGSARIKVYKGNSWSATSNERIAADDQVHRYVAVEKCDGSSYRIQMSSNDGELATYVILTATATTTM